MESAAGAASMGGAMGTGLSGPAIPGSYTGQVTFDEWKRRRGIRPGQYWDENDWSMWQDFNSEQGRLMSQQPGTLKSVPKPEPEREEVGSSPGFEKVQRFLRQQRATGRVVSPNETRMAWQGYWDAWAGKQTERERIGIERERLDLQAKQWAWQRSFSEEGRELDEDTAAASAGAMIGMGIGFAVGGPVGAFAGGAIGGMIGGSK